MIPKNRGKNFSSGFLHSEFFGAGRGELLCRHSIDCCFVSSPGHSDITRFRPWSPNATENHLGRAEPKKNPKFAQ